MAETGVVRLFPGAEARNPDASTEASRIVEAILFASAEPVAIEDLAARLPADTDVGAALARLQQAYAGRGVNVVRVAGKWAFRTAPDLAYMMRREEVEQKKLSRAAMETLAIIAYHQPVTRAEIEDIRGVSISRGTLDVLIEAGWVKLRGRRKVPGRPVTFGTTEGFLEHFGLGALDDLPGVEELNAAGLLAPLPPSTAAGEDADPTEAESEDELDLGFLDPQPADEEDRRAD